MDYSEIMKYLKSIDKRLSKIEKQGSEVGEWINEKTFMERTGIDSRSKLSRWRQENPDLWSAQKTFTRGGVTAHSGFMYNWKDYLAKLKPHLK